jgi:DNA-binding GntR family transcriptional regulator
MVQDRREQLLYEQVMALIETMIDDNKLQPGARLPTNKELSELAGVSLISVRRALDELERAGRVRRHQGVGTFVAAERILTSPALAGGLLETLTSGVKHQRIDTRLLDVSQGTPSADIATALALPKKTQVWCIRRLRVIADRPMINETSYIPVTLTPGLDEALDGYGGSLYQLLGDRFGLVDAYEEQQLEIIKPTPAERKSLSLTGRDLVARIRGVSFSVNGSPFDCFEQVYPVDGFTFYLSGRTDRQVLPQTHSGTWSLSPNR